MKPYRALIVIGLAGGVGLAYELALMRIMALAEWHHFAYMIISIALLGFAAAGTYLTLFRPPGRRRAARLTTFALALLLPVLPASYGLSQWIPYETYELTADPRQVLYLGVLYGVLAVPFFLISLVLVLGFYRLSGRVGRVYAANLAGSGAGAAAVLGLMYVVRPAALPYGLLGGVAVAFLLSLRVQRRTVLIGLAWTAAVLGVVGYTGVVPVEVSSYKPLARALDDPGARIVARAQNPLAEVTAVRSKRLRETPGQLSNYPFRREGGLPEQIGLFFDGTGPSVVNRLDSGPLAAAARHLDYVTGALPYHLLERPDVYVAGAGGGTAVLMALGHGAAHVTATEINPSVIPLMRGRFSGFSGGLYDRSDVTVRTADGRGHLTGTPRTFDLIDLGLGGGYAASMSGAGAIQADYSLTVEAVVTYLEALGPDGILAVTRWLQSPPRDAVRSFATLIEGAERAGIERPGRHLAMVRSWNTATMVLSRSPLDDAQLASLRAFSRERWFDRAWDPGMSPSEANRYVVLDDAHYYRINRRLLSGEREGFYRNYPFYVRPATDDRPYPHRFVKVGSPREMVRAIGAPDRPLEEWGYLVLWLTLFQGAVLSLILVIMPALPAVAFRGQLVPGAAVLLYFGLVGIAYMALEIGFIQQFMRFLHYPVHATAAVLTSFLVFSGLGSLASERVRGRRARIVLLAALIILVWVLAGTRVWPMLFQVGAGWSDAVRLLATVLVLAPLAVPMGVLFPVGLQVVADRRRELMAWGWAVNGAASVVGAVLARLAGVHLGLGLLTVGAAGLYLLSAAVFPLMVRSVE